MSNRDNEGNRKSADRLSALVGSRLYAARGARHLSREHVADVLGWSVKTLERTEKGQRELKAREIDQIAAWLGTSPAKLVAD